MGTNDGIQTLKDPVSRSLPGMGELGRRRVEAMQDASPASGKTTKVGRWVEETINTRIFLEL